MNRVFKIVIVFFVFFGCNDSQIKKVYYDNGNIKEYIPIENNSINGELITYYENGRVNKKSKYKNDKKNGLSEHFYENGLRKYKADFVDGKQEGWTYFYDTTGVLKERQFFSNDDNDGKFVRFFEDGEIQFLGQFYDSIDSHYVLERFYGSDSIKSYRYEKAGETIYYKEFDVNGIMIASLLPVKVDTTSKNNYCIELKHSMYPKRDLRVRFYFGDGEESIVVSKSNNEYIEGDSSIVCLDRENLLTNNSLKGYFCEIIENEIGGCKQIIIP